MEQYLYIALINAFCAGVCGCFTFVFAMDRQVGVAIAEAMFTIFNIAMTITNTIDFLKVYNYVKKD